MQNLSESKSLINEIININNFEWKIISKNENLYLIELLQGSTRFIVNLDDKSLHATKARDSGISFDGTGYIMGEKIDVKNLKPFVPAYSGQNLIERIMKILNLNTNIGWKIIDSVENLYLIHYNDDADMNLLGHLRGVLVDVVAGLVIASSYGYTPTVKCDCLRKNQDNNISLYDDDGNYHEFAQNNTFIKKVYEGVVLRVIYYKGEVFRLTHKKIRPMKSRWGNTNFFPVMYNQGGGPQDFELFDLTKEYSPMCYVFLVVDPKLLIGTRQIVNNPYVIFLSTNTMYDIQHSPYPLEELEINFTPTILLTEETNNAIEDGKKIIVQKNLSLKEANKHLTSGYYNPVNVVDYRLSTGEAIIMFKYNELGNIIDVVKVHCYAFDWRVKLRANDPNPYHRFFDLLNYSYKTLIHYPNLIEFNKNFILLADYSIENLTNLINKDGIINYLAVNTLTDYQKNDRFYILKIIWLNYVLSLSATYQLQALSYYDKLVNDRESVILWIQRIEENPEDIKLSHRTLNIIQSARETSNNYKRINNVNQTNVKDIIRNFIYKEHGSSLYSLIKLMKK
jgi:hypothetical protein